MSPSLQSPEFRFDPLTNRWVIVAHDRAARPYEFIAESTKRVQTPCPFCAGREGDTPAPVSVYPNSSRRNSQDWQIRVVPNRFPALVPVAEILEPPTPQITDVLTQWKPFVGKGVHEVIIEGPCHTVSLSELEDEQTILTFTAYRDRMKSLHDQGRWAYIQIFKNVGAAAGSSVEHAHSQLVALPWTPRRVAQEVDGSRKAYESLGRSFFEALLERELKEQTRIVSESDFFVAFCPYWSRFPYEICVLPKRLSWRFERLSDEEIESLALFVKGLVKRVERTLGSPAYNYLIHTAPFDGSGDGHYSWHVEFIPRLIKVAGFEMATGCYINPVPPELAAQRLRAAVHESEFAHP